jgi:integrase
MPRKAAGLSAAKVSKAKPGRYGDGGGLYLLVRGPAAKFWSFRYVKAGRMREVGLGPATGTNAITLADARRKARDLHDIHKAGRDPLAERAAGLSQVRAAAVKGRTFEAAAEEYIDTYRDSWRNAVHAKQWATTLKTYVFPKIGAMLVSDIETAHVVDVLSPIWTAKSETASRVRSRIELILAREKALGRRSGENPAAWKENLAAVLPKPSKVRRSKHHEAMPAKQIGDFMAKLRGDTTTIARALEFCIVTCTRTSEVLHARFDEIDLDWVDPETGKPRPLWVIPGSRMKAGREHRVALSTRAVEIVKEMEQYRVGDYLFGGRVRGGIGPLSANVLLTRLRRMGYADYAVHGFRSSFRDWTSDSTNFPGEVAEMALAHVASDKTERAYRRGDALEKRYALAEAWSTFCSKPSIKDGAKIVNMRRRSK